MTSHKLGNRTINRTYDPAGRLLSVGSVQGSDYATADTLLLNYYPLGNLG